MYKGNVPISKKDKLDFWAKRKEQAYKMSVKLLNKEITLDQVPNRYNPNKSKNTKTNKALNVVLPEFVENAPVYILIRTHHRPEYFKRCMASIKAQTYPNIKVIVHTDDPRDTYVEGDIIIKGQCFHPKTGTGPYNLYNNRLLEAIPSGWGWYHYIDDDDYYAEVNVIERLVKNSKPSCVNVGKVERARGTFWPKSWRVQRSYQTECFFMHSAYKDIARWWANTGGDHYYSRQLTDQLPINWIDNLLICRAQDGKNRGRPVDLGRKVVDYSKAYAKHMLVDCLVIQESAGRPGEIISLEYGKGYELEKNGKVRLTYKGVSVETIRNRPGEKSAETDQRESLGDTATTDKRKIPSGNDSSRHNDNALADNSEVRSDIHEPCTGTHPLVSDTRDIKGAEEDMSRDFGNMGSGLQVYSESVSEETACRQVEEI